MCIFGSRTLVPISWSCKKVRHSITGSEVISSDTFRMDGSTVLNLWDLVTAIFHPSAQEKFMTIK